MKIEICLLVLGLVLIQAQRPATRTRKGPPPVRAVPRRNDIKDVPDNAGRAAPPPLAAPAARAPPPPAAPAARRLPPPAAPAARRLPPPAVPAARAPPPPAPPAARAPPPAAAPSPVVRGPPPPRARPAPIQHPAPLVRPYPPITRTKSAGFLSGPERFVPYIPPAPTSMPPFPAQPPTTQYYPQYDTREVKKEEEEES